MLRAARYLGVAPWDLVEQPIQWSVWANMAESAELEAQQSATKRGIDSAHGNRGR